MPAGGVGRPCRTHCSCAQPQAYKAWLRTHGEEQQLPAVGLTNHQLFFVGFAQVLPSWEAWGLPVSHSLLGVSLEVGGMQERDWEMGPKMVCGRWSGEALYSEPHAWGPLKPVRMPEEGEVLRRLLQISKGRAALLEGDRVGSRIEPQHVAVRWLWRKKLKLGDKVAHPGIPRNKVSGRV